jgi:hypothetical protein
VIKDTVEYLNGLREFATPVQERIIDALIECDMNFTKASKLLGTDHRGNQRSLKSLKAKAAAKGYAPANDMTKPAAEGFTVSGTSTLYDEAGNLKIQWVKTKADKDQVLTSVLNSFQDAFEGYKATSELVKSPKTSNKEMLTVYPMGDPHFGMLAWSQECGESFDLKIAEKDLKDAVRNLVDRSPPSHTAIILNLGDFFHADSKSSTTTAGTDVDTDARWNKVLNIGARALIECVYSALKKHKRVIVKNVIGNHDEHTSQALALALSLYFENNKRVTVDNSPSKFWFYRHGEVLIGSTHGDSCKPEKLSGVMATDMAEDWGKTKHRYWYTGHIHSKNSMELAGCMWESFRTLASKDAWHTAQGYRSGRDMSSIHIHERHGEVERHTMSLSSLRDQQLKESLNST